MTVKLSAKLTKKEQDYNGFDPINRRLCDKDDLMHGEHYGVFKGRVTDVHFDVETGEWVATVKFDHIEPAFGDSGDAAKVMLEELYHERTKRPDAPPEQLPLDGPVSERQPDAWLDKS